MGINAYFLGHLGRPAEIKQTEKGVVAVFSVAVAGQQKDDTEWLECCFFGERARKVAPFLGKGSQVMVSGLLKKEIFTRKNGQTACQLKVLVRGLEFCGQAKKEERAQPQAPAVAQNYSAASINDLPF